MRVLFLAMTLIFMAGCKGDWQALCPGSNNAEALPFRWAVVDTRAIEEVLQDIAREQNPYPERLREGQSMSQTDQSNLVEQINRLESAARRKCMRPDLKELVDQGKGLECENSHAPWCQQFWDQSCLAAIHDDPQIVALRKKNLSAGEKHRLEERYRSAMREVAKDAANSIIASYGKDQFELIVDKLSSHVVYAKNGMVLDVTQSVIEHIQKNPVNLKLTEEQIWMKGER